MLQRIPIKDICWRSNGRFRIVINDEMDATFDDQYIDGQYMDFGHSSIELNLKWSIQSLVADSQNTVVIHKGFLKSEFTFK